MITRTLAAAVVVATALGVAFAYFGARGGLDAAAPHDDGERSVALVTPPVVDRAATHALERDGDRDAVATRQPTAATDEQIRAATIPLERAMAGFEQVKLRMQLEPTALFRDTVLQFVAETDDPEWAPATEAHILGQIAQATGLSAGNVQVDCRTTLCRVLLTRPVSAPNSRYDGWTELVASFGLEGVLLLAMPDETGTPINLAYVRRGAP